MDTLEMSEKTSDAKSETKVRLLEDVLQGVPHSPVLIRQMLGMFSINSDPTKCDVTPQGPDITGEKVQDTCSLPLWQMYPAVKDSVAQAVAGADNVPATFGTAFLLCDDKCFYVTNNHVAGKNDEVGIANPDGKTVDYGKVVARDQNLDLVLVEPPPGTEHRTPVKIGELPKPGDGVFTVGHPLASQFDVITSGKVTATSTSLDVKDPETKTVQHYTNLIKSTELVFPGNSGGPEFNKSGEVVGIKVVGTQNGSVSIPIQSALEMVRKAEGK